MEFACDRCRKRYSTSYQPVAGRVYRIPCKCGNTIVLRFDQPRQAAPPPVPRKAAVRLTPPPLPDRYLCMANGRARAGATMAAGERAPAPGARSAATSPRTAPVQAAPAQTAPTNDGAPRVRLDPTASPEITGEYAYEPSTSVPFGVAFALSRRRAFLAGCGAGAGGAFVLVGAVMLLAWLSGPRSENPVTSAPQVNIASKTERAPAAVAAAVPRRVKQASTVIVAPLLIEEASESRPTAVDREAAASAGDDEAEEAEDSPASAHGSEAKLARAEDREASNGAESQAQTPEAHGPAVDEGAAAVTEAPAQAEGSPAEPSRVALVPVVDEETAAPDGAPGALEHEHPEQ